MSMVADGAAKGIYSFAKSILQARCNDYKIMAYKHEGYFSKITDIKSYYNANMALLDTDKRQKLFPDNAPVYTKVRDNPPAKFAIGAKVKNSLIADGCIIEGTVENSVLFRGVKVGKGAVIKNSIVMQSSVIEEKAAFINGIADKDVTITKNRTITGSAEYPVFITKGATV